MSRSKRLAFLLALAASTTFAKEPSVIFAGPAGKKISVAMIGFKDAYTEPLANCRQHIVEVVVGEIAYDGPSEIIVGSGSIQPQMVSRSIALIQ